MCLGVKGKANQEQSYYYKFTKSEDIDPEGGSELTQTKGFCSLDLELSESSELGWFREYVIYHMFDFSAFRTPSSLFSAGLQ